MYKRQMYPERLQKFMEQIHAKYPKIKLCGSSGPSADGKDLSLIHIFISIYYGSLAALHLTVRQLYHAVREVNQVLTPLETETVEQDREYLEVVVPVSYTHLAPMSCYW